MTGPTGLINFFVLEASDYVEQLDVLLRDAGPAGPEAESFTRVARALRGSATMAKRRGIAALAAAVERLGRALRERVLPWTPEMRDALDASVEDLRQLVRTARDYDAMDEQRAQNRTATLLAFAPPSMRAAAPTPIASGSGTMFVVSGANDVAAALTASAARPANHELHAEALSRLRGFRGVAALRDHPLLAETLDIVERVARNVDRQQGLPSPSATAVIATGARQLRRLAEDIRAGRVHDRRSPEAVAFADAVARHETTPTVSEDVVVPIASLFFTDDGPRIVRQTAEPVTTAADRFRLESAAAAEHLRRLSGELRRELGGETSPADAAQFSSQSPALQVAADSLAELAHSYGYDDLGTSLSRALAELDPSDALALASADAVSALLVGQRRRIDDLARRIGDLAAGRMLGSLVATGYVRLGQLRTTPVATPTAQAASPAPSVSPAAPAESPASATTWPAAPAEVPPSATTWPAAPAESPASATTWPAAPAEVPPSATTWPATPAGVSSVDAEAETGPEQSTAQPTAAPGVEPAPLSQSASETWLEPAAGAADDPPAKALAAPTSTDVEVAPAAVRDELLAPTRTSSQESKALPPETHQPTGRDLQALLASSIAGFEQMDTPASGTATDPAHLRATPAATDWVAGSTDGEAGTDDGGEPVPVEILLYRGRSALGRALELRDEIRRQGGIPPAEQLDELFDLLDLAATA